MNKNQKLIVASFLLGALITLTVHISQQVLFADAIESERFTSVGTPQVIQLDKSKGEQKVLMNDPSIQKNWGLMGTHGQSDIKANEAWGITQGDRQIVIAVIDTGVDISHPDLASNIWTNPGESGRDEKGRDKATNGVDDDKNGYTDDVHGWDFVNDKPSVVDNHGHGTHIAGIIGAVGGNGVGISGVAPKCSIMALKYFDPNSHGNDNLKNTIRAVRYAVRMGAQIINYSGGGTEPNDDEFQAVKFANEKGVLFVAAAGNEQSNSDVAHYYPADYNLSNVISVTAIDSFAKVLRSSNYGTNTVDLAAPGEGIYSTLPGGNFGLMTGTSQATAFVTGVAALIMSHNKDFSAEQVKKQIIATADELPGLHDKTKTSGKLNSYAALAIQPGIPASGIARSSSSPSDTGLIGTDKRRNSILFDDEEAPVSGATLSNLIRAINRPVAGEAATPVLDKIRN
jgi:thermitase